MEEKLNFNFQLHNLVLYFFFLQLDRALSEILKMMELDESFEYAWIKWVKLNKTKKEVASFM